MLKMILLMMIGVTQVKANQEILSQYEKEMKGSFSSSEGEKFYRSTRKHSSGEMMSCTTCHTDNPKNQGLTRANKIVQPIAPVSNPERFTDKAKVEKWFKRNCKDVYERECSVQEKGNFIKYMMSVK